jgi:DNA-binding beta-propeller fold protein YncE
MVGTNARFNTPVGVTISADGLFAVVADTINNLIRSMILSSLSVTTIAGVATAGALNGVGTNARFSGPRGIDISPDNLFVLVADSNNNLIRQVIISTGSVTTLAGSTVGSTNGLGTNAKFSNPTGLSISPDKLFALVAEYANDLIRQIIISTGSVTTLAGAAAGSTNGVGTNARFYTPYGISISADMSFALVGDQDNNLIRKMIL